MICRDNKLPEVNKWYDSYKRWTNVCLRGIVMDDSMKWDMLIAAGGEDLHNFMKEAGIMTEKSRTRSDMPPRKRKSRPTKTEKEVVKLCRNNRMFPKYQSCYQL